MEYFIIIWIVCGIFAGVVANSKGHSGCAWFVGGLFFGIFALIAAAGIAPAQREPDLTQAALAMANNAAALRKCPHCAELIQREARVCRYCQREVEPLPPPVSAVPARSDDNARGVALLILLIVAAFVVILIATNSHPAASRWSAAPDAICNAARTIALRHDERVAAFASAAQQAAPYGEGLQSGEGAVACFFTSGQRNLTISARAECVGDEAPLDCLHDVTAQIAEPPRPARRAHPAPAAPAPETTTTPSADADPKPGQSTDTSGKNPGQN
jgi:hypothetical protein